MITKDSLFKAFADFLCEKNLFIEFQEQLLFSKGMSLEDYINKFSAGHSNSRITAATLVISAFGWGNNEKWRDLSDCWAKRVAKQYVDI